MWRLRRTIDQQLFVLRFARRQEITQSINIVAETLGQFVANCARLGDDRIVYIIHMVINSSGVHTSGLHVTRKSIPLTADIAMCKASAWL